MSEALVGGVCVHLRYEKGQDDTIQFDKGVGEDMGYLVVD